METDRHRVRYRKTKKKRKQTKQKLTNSEICLLANSRRVASVVAASYCSLYSLDRENFLRVLEKYPLMRRTMEGVAAERLHIIGQNPLLVSNRNDLKEDQRMMHQIVLEVHLSILLFFNSLVCVFPSLQLGDDQVEEQEKGQQTQHKKSSSGNRRKSMMKLGLEKIGFGRHRGDHSRPLTNNRVNYVNDDVGSPNSSSSLVQPRSATKLKPHNVQLPCDLEGICEKEEHSPSAEKKLCQIRILPPSHHYCL